MIIENIDKHLTDQEFFTYIKFFDLVIKKKPFNSDYGNNIFNVYNLKIGDDELLRKCMTQS